MTRLKRGFPRLETILLLAVAICGTAEQARASTALTESPNTPSTCPSRSINYITESLPQQCLTSSWTSRETIVPATSEIQHVDATATHTDIASRNDSEHDAATSADTGGGTGQSIANASSSQTPQPSQEDSQSSTATLSEAHATSTSISHETPTEPESPLDNANFLSFEDWKRQNLEKAGQSTETFEKREDNGHQGRVNRPSMLQSTLDSLGEDTEIDIDFGGFVNADQLQGSMPSDVRGASEEKKTHDGAAPTDSHDTSSPHRRNKDAGKTCKERSNYASFDCAATVLKTNQECKGATSVLVENKDSYMLNVCSVKNKFLILELCDDILIDTIVLANFEFFSSMFRTFRVSVSDRFPVKMDKWKELGVYEARNAREIQAFLVENPLIWARYLRIEFLSHFGKEYYCPLSLLRVHGTTMMEEFNHELKGRGEDDTDTDSIDEGSEDMESGQDLVVAIPHSPSSSKVSTTTSAVTHTSLVKEVVETTPSTSPVPAQSTIEVVSEEKTATSSTGPSETSVRTALPAHIFRQNVTNDQSQFCESTAHTRHPTSTVDTASSSRTESSPTLDQTPPSKRQESTVAESPSQVDTIATPIASKPSMSSSRAQSASVQPATPSPTTQESFFKSVHKRLQQLEANSTLSLQYIEEQSRILREAFSKVEKRQLTKTSDFLTGLNNSVLTELRDFRHQYDQIWQSTVLELSAQREQSRQEMSALSKRLNYLSDDMVFQKRISSLQFMLILICLGFVIFPRHITGNSNHFEFPPFVQNALHRSTASLTSGRTPLNTPPTSPPSTRPASRYGLLKTLATSRHRRSPSEESELQPHQVHKTPSTDFSPPTPESIRDEFSEPEIPSKGPDDLVASPSSSPERQLNLSSQAHDRIGPPSDLTPAPAGSHLTGDNIESSSGLMIEVADDDTRERPSTS